MSFSAPNAMVESIDSTFDSKKIFTKFKSRASREPVARCVLRPPNSVMLNLYSELGIPNLNFRCQLSECS